MAENKDVNEILARFIRIMNDKAKTIPKPMDERLFSFKEIYDESCSEHFYQFEKDNTAIRDKVKDSFAKTCSIVFVNDDLFKQRE
jgi:hypothetical protein